MEQAPRRHEGQEKSLEGDAGFPPPGNRKKGGRGLELSLPRHRSRRPAIPHPVQGSGALGKTPRGRCCTRDSGGLGWGEGGGPNIRALELVSEKAGECVQRARRGLGKGDKLGHWVEVDPVFNP